MRRRKREDSTSSPVSHWWFMYMRDGCPALERLTTIGLSAKWILERRYIYAADGIHETRGVLHLNAY